MYECILWCMYSKYIACLCIKLVVWITIISISSKTLNIKRFLPLYLMFQKLYIYIYIGWGESGFHCWGLSVCARVILVLRECIWNAPLVSLVHPVFGLPGFSSTSGGLSPWFHTGWLPPISLQGIKILSWNPPLSLHSYFSLFSCPSTSPDTPVIWYLWGLPVGVTP